MGGVKGTKYLLKIRNHAPRKAENSVPSLFFEMAGDNKLIQWLPYPVLSKTNGLMYEQVYQQVTELGVRAPRL